MGGIYIKKLIDDGALVEDFSVELLCVYPLEECLEREKELAKTSLFPAGLNGNAGYYIEMTDEVREKIRKNNKERVENNTHNFLGGDLQRKNNKERVENNTHHFLGGEITRRSNKKRVSDNTHNFLGKGLISVFDKVEQKIISRIHKDIYYNNRDRYLHLSSKEYKELMGLENNNHNFLGKGFMTVFDKVEQKIISRIHKDIYYNNRDRYLTLSSKEYKQIREQIKQRRIRK